MTDDMEIIAAGVLHDIVEDTDGTLDEIRKRFGDRVAMIVDSETENDYPGEDRSATWLKRKEQSLEKLRYIWPGTFDSSKTKYREYRTISVEGCQCIGKGAKGSVYRYDDELIVKVYNEKNTYKDVEREIALTKTAFVMGLPTAISFGIVSVGKRYIYVMSGSYTRKSAIINHLPYLIF